MIIVSTITNTTTTPITISSSVTGSTTIVNEVLLYGIENNWSIYTNNANILSLLAHNVTKQRPQQSLLQQQSMYNRGHLAAVDIVSTKQLWDQSSALVVDKCEKLVLKLMTLCANTCEYSNEARKEMFDGTMGPSWDM